MSSRQIELALSREAQNMGLDERRMVGEPPKDKTIRSYVVRFGKLPEEEKRQYRVFSWPESMENGSLPWEASRAALDLLLYYGREANRPLIRVVKWFWRLTIAMPDRDVQERDIVARQLAAWELVRQEQPEVVREYEWFLAYAPWRQGRARQDYDDARMVGLAPYVEGVTLNFGKGNFEKEMEMRATLFGTDSDILKVARKEHAKRQDSDVSETEEANDQA